MSERRPFLLPMPASAVGMVAGSCAYCGGPMLVRLASSEVMCLSDGRRQPEAR